MLEKLQCNVDDMGAVLVSGVNSLQFNKPSSTAKLLNKMRVDSGDACLLIVGDSTGNESTEWVYLYAEWLAEQFPAYTVDYYLWDTGTNNYAAPVELQSGLGPNTLSVYNASIAGSKPNRFAGTDFPTAIIDIPRVDLFILNHGHNLIIGSARDQYFFRTPEFLEFIASVTQIHEGCGMAMMAQNPRRDDNDYAVIYETILDAAALINADLANGYVKFIEAEKSPDLYTDNTHPNAAGQQLLLCAMQEVSFYGCPSPALSPINNSGSTIYEVDFSSYAGGGAPSGWSLLSATADLETTIVETAGKSVKLSSVTGSVALMQYALLGSQLAQVKNKWITLTARLYIDPASSGQPGLVGIWTPTETTNNTLGVKEKGAWYWHCISYFVPSDASDVRLRVYANGLSSTPSGQVCYVDRVILSTGRLPRDMY